MGWAPGALLTALAALVAVRAQITEPGICPFSTPVSDWNEEQFVSEPWYEIKAFAVPGVHDAAFSPGCTRWHFAKSDDGLGLHARLAYRGREGDGIIRAFAQYTNSERYPRFNLTFHDLAGAAAPRSVDMKLIATDYDDFALLWGCNEPNLFERNVVSWVLSRRPFLSEAAQEALRSAFRKHDIRAEKFVDTDHDQQTCGAPYISAAMSARPLPGVDDGVDSVFAAYRPGQQAAGLHAEQETSPSSDQPSDDDSASADGVDAVDADVSWNYVGAAWPLLSSQAVLVAVLLALAVVSLIASLLTFRALMQRVQRRRGVGASKPMLPMHRQDVIVATLGPVVDYSRFGGLGQGLVQTRKHAADQGSQGDWPRT
ncbi:lazarillo protein-like [Thrips palmi]|uniref:Lazarillo protein-like n=1 Tax=Thrips palmi TaxID=161013 RepID=A0A6P8Z7U3_THRPL|nr:lazarillo protein-like [Thrips palmi]